MKLFVWEGEGVLEDYTSGMICVLAKNINEAIALINVKYGGELTDYPKSKYEVIEKPEAFICFGGG
jgi:predicted fused transcriptional regulator/phosphomethylpyrimidine kinase